ncbi:MAG: porin family protein [Alphaproteobacteria bacterium]|nr:porin family protein [Alphaproteobacteria bacterium]
MAKTVAFLIGILLSFNCTASQPINNQGSANNDLYKDYYTKVSYSNTNPTGSNLKNGYSFKSAFGKKINDFLKWEFQLAYNRNHLKNKFYGNKAEGKISSKSAMVNLGVDFNNSTRFTPFFFSGAGYSYNKFDAFINDKLRKSHKNSLTYQFGAGLTIDLPNGLSIDLSYSRSNQGLYKFIFDEETIERAPETDAYSVGLKFDF